MARKSLGYVELEWPCPYCGHRNPGTQEKCASCGSPQPEDVQFVPKAQAEFIEDEAKIQRAQAGPDIHCAYCGTRNPATATTCTQCGADLKEGTARASGQKLGEHRHEKAPDVICEFCGTANEANALKCSQCGAALANPAQPKPTSQTSTQPATPAKRGTPVWLYGIGAFLLLCLCGFIFLSMRTTEATGEVTSVQWTRSVAIEEFGPVDREGWYDEIPSSADVGSCSERVHHTQSNPAPGAEEVCGEPYTIDTGSGVGEVVQDCEYRVYEDWCSYTIDEWRQIREVSEQGNDFSPYWPDPSLSRDQRQGQRSENYRITFAGDGDSYNYSTGNFNEFQRYEIGSRWLLNVNTFGQVNSVEPLR